MNIFWFAMAIKGYEMWLCLKLSLPNDFISHDLIKVIIINLKSGSSLH